MANSRDAIYASYADLPADLKQAVMAQAGARYSHDAAGMDAQLMQNGALAAQAMRAAGINMGGAPANETMEGLDWMDSAIERAGGPRAQAAPSSSRGARQATGADIPLPPRRPNADNSTAGGSTAAPQPYGAYAAEQGMQRDAVMPAYATMPVQQFIASLFGAQPAVASIDRNGMPVASPERVYNEATPGAMAAAQAADEGAAIIAAENAKAQQMQEQRTGGQRPTGVADQIVLGLRGPAALANFQGRNKQAPGNMAAEQRYADADGPNLRAAEASNEMANTIKRENAKANAGSEKLDLIETSYGDIAGQELARAKNDMPRDRADRNVRGKQRNKRTAQR